MDPNTVQAFAAIKQFVEALVDAYEPKTTVTPLRLYQRLLSFVEPAEADRMNIDKFLRGFRAFYARYNDALVTGDLRAIPRGTVIPFSKNAYVDVQKFLHKARGVARERNQIRIHLLTIQAFLEPDDDKAHVLLEKVTESEQSSPEDHFVGDIVRKAQAAIEDLDPDTAEDPVKAVAGLMSSGVLTDMIVGLQRSVGAGEMDPARLLQSMQGTMAQVLGDPLPCGSPEPVEVVAPPPPPPAQSGGAPDLIPASPPPEEPSPPPEAEGA